MYQKIDRLRDEVTRMLSIDAEQKVLKHKKYQEIYNLSRDIGYFNRMVEVSRFVFGDIPIKPEDYEICMEAALKNKNLASFVSCKKALNRKITFEEAEEFGLAKTSARLVLDLITIIKKHIPENSLSPEEWVLIEFC